MLQDAKAASYKRASAPISVLTHVSLYLECCRSAAVARGIWLASAPLPLHRPQNLWSKRIVPMPITRI